MTCKTVSLNIDRVQFSLLLHLTVLQRASGLLNHLMTLCLDLTQYNLKTNNYRRFVTLLKVICLICNFCFEFSLGFIFEFT